MSAAPPVAFGQSEQVTPSEDFRGGGPLLPPNPRSDLTFAGNLSYF